MDFWAPWCGPCLAVAPILEQLATKYDGKVESGKVVQQLVGLRSVQELEYKYGLHKMYSQRLRKSDPCFDRSNEYLESYSSQENQLFTKAASELLDNGRACTLTRLEEIVEYSKLHGYTSIGVSYCYGMEKEAILLREYLEQEGYKPTMVSCTVDGIKESQIDISKTKNTVSCNPIGRQIF